jgi:uncharacterized PurR-regulated membrane protein YhhQ (DUF165 family)
MTRRALAALILLAYIGTIVAANWAIQRYGLVPVGFGLLAPAGVYFAGLGFTLRDLAQDLAGRWAALAAIVVGAGLSWFVADPAFAIASAVAFGASEMLDFAVYTPLRKRGWLTAVTASNIVGLIADSLIFLWLAFGSLQFLAGQIVGKTWMTVLAVLLLAAGRYAYRTRKAQAA